MGCSPGALSVMSPPEDKTIQMKAPEPVQELEPLSSVQFNQEDRLIRLSSALIHELAINEATEIQLLENPPKDFLSVIAFIQALADQKVWSFAMEFVGYDTIESVLVWISDATRLISALIRQTTQGGLFGFSFIGSPFRISRQQYKYCADPEELLSMLRPTGLKGFINLYFPLSLRPQLLNVHRFLPDRGYLILSNISEIDLHFEALVTQPTLLPDPPSPEVFFSHYVLPEDLVELKSLFSSAIAEGNTRVYCVTEYSTFQLDMVAVGLYCESQGRLFPRFIRQGSHYLISNWDEGDFAVFRGLIQKQLREQPGNIAAQSLLDVTECHVVLDGQFVQETVNRCMQEFLCSSPGIKTISMSCGRTKLETHIRQINELLEEKTGGKCHCVILGASLRLEISRR